ncbi:hypothetical protein OG417_07940 [Actinoallomurus sp. NBC_01490]|uniref:hypothetical protein n=1 Tax=Actinoallomurus sp. NBC_01490 TaxID=2903557 RepID=UPI002E34B096|nr:hypothetical protein [Actinoallomurus sp. NBC_01490]
MRVGRLQAELFGGGRYRRAQSKFAVYFVQLGFQFHHRFLAGSLAQCRLSDVVFARINEREPHHLWTLTGIAAVQLGQCSPQPSIQRLSLPSWQAAEPAVQQFQQPLRTGVLVRDKWIVVAQPGTHPSAQLGLFAIASTGGFRQFLREAVPVLAPLAVGSHGLVMTLFATPGRCRGSEFSFLLADLCRHRLYRCLDQLEKAVHSDMARQFDCESRLLLRADDHGTRHKRLRDSEEFLHRPRDRLARHPHVPNAAAALADATGRALGRARVHLAEPSRWSALCFCSAALLKGFDGLLSGAVVLFLAVASAPLGGLP